MAVKIRMQGVVRGLLVVASVVGGFLLVGGRDCLKPAQQVRAEIVQVRGEVGQLEAEVTSIKEEIAAWNQDDFGQEKVAREQLMLGKANELVFIF